LLSQIVSFRLPDCRVAAAGVAQAFEFARKRGATGSPLSFR